MYFEKWFSITELFFSKEILKEDLRNEIGLWRNFKFGMLQG